MRMISIMFVFVLLLGVGSNSEAGSAREQIATIATTADDNGVVQGKEGWLFLKDELEHLGSKSFYGPGVLESTKAAKQEFADPLPAIIDFNNQLKDRGIELVFAPIPPKALIYPDKLLGALSPEMVTELARPYTELYAKLSEQGVTVLDLIPIFQEGSAEKQLYCKTDTHFSGAGLAKVSEEFGAIIKASEWFNGVEKKNYSEQERSVAIHGDLAVMEKSDSKEDIPLLFISDSATGKVELPNPESPVLLLGDSHTLVFSVGGDLHSSGAGLFDQLNANLGFAVDLLGVRGSGATPSRIKLYQRSRKDSSFLKKKKIVIWCLSARELTGSGGWRKIPVAKK